MKLAERTQGGWRQDAKTSLKSFRPLLAVTDSDMSIILVIILRFNGHKEISGTNSSTRTA